MSLSDLKNKTLQALEQGAVDRHSGFRWAILSTTNTSSQPEARVLVLRKFDKRAGIVTFFTDCRTPKVREIGENPAVSLLIFNREQMVQIRVAGTARIVTIGDKGAGDEAFQIWQTLPETGRGDYLSQDPPGTPISPEAPISRLPDTPEHFCLIQVTIRELEWLSLSREGHQRAKFKRIKGGRQADFKGQIIVP